MRKIFFTLLALAFGAMAVACSENERMTYDPDMHDIYYTLVTDTRDSLTISLLTADEVSTHTVTVALMGHMLESPIKFAVEVVAEKSTAQEGVHFEKLPEYFEFPADTFYYDIPFKLIKSDPILGEKELVLTLRLTSISDLNIAYPDKTDLRVKFSNMLLTPEGYDYYGDMTAFRSLFGDYSKTKHLMIIELTGHDFWDGNYGTYGGVYGILYEKAYYTPYARKLYKIITSGTYYDENGNLMTGWDVP